MTTRRDVLSHFTSGFVGGIGALATVGAGKWLSGDNVSNITPALTITDEQAKKFLLYKRGLYSFAKDVAGMPEKSEAFQSFLWCCEHVRSEGYDVHEMYGRVFGPGTGGVDIVDTLWIRFPDGDTPEFRSAWSIEKNQT
jgi:hypothetical protein